MNVTPQWNVCPVLDDPQALIAMQGHPRAEEMDLECKLNTLQVYSCAYITLVFWSNQTKRMALVFEGDVLTALGTVLPFFLRSLRSSHWS